MVPWSGISKFLPLVAKLGDGLRSFHPLPCASWLCFPWDQKCVYEGCTTGQSLALCVEGGGSLYGSLDHETSHIRVASQ